MKISEEVGSKYRFIILAGQRVSQLQKGAKPRIENAEKMKHTQIAVEELEAEALQFNKLILNEDGSVAGRIEPDGTTVHVDESGETEEKEEE
ncbi:MAG: DNA-directed RNA polymerase subunit omega [Acidobacteriota bacterium]|nr:DNA-directed RNA polymerase subunit omega [Acidobacteriota bacterium]